VDSKRFCDQSVKSMSVLKNLFLLSVGTILMSNASASPYSFGVKTSGHGKPMILIPALASGGNVWDGTVAHYRQCYRCYVLTLPGFAGQRAVKWPILRNVRDQIVQLMADKGMKGATVVGDRLGGTLALWVAATRPQSVEKVISIDGMPWMAGYLQGHAMDHGDEAISEICKKSGPKFIEEVRQVLNPDIVPTGKYADVRKQIRRSDPSEVGEALSELYKTDLRPDMKRMKCRVLFVIAGHNYELSETRSLVAHYVQRFIDVVPNSEMEIIRNSDGFAMLDDPEEFLFATDPFLK